MSFQNNRFHRSMKKKEFLANCEKNAAKHSVVIYLVNIYFECKKNKRLSCYILYIYLLLKFLDTDSASWYFIRQAKNDCRRIYLTSSHEKMQSDPHALDT